MRNDAKRGRGKHDSRDQRRAGLDPVFIFFFRLQGCLLSFRQQIAETESVAHNFFADANRDRGLKYGAIENVRVEFAVLTAGVDAWRQIGEEGSVQLAPREGRIENAGIDADGDRSKTQSHKFPRKFTRVALPDGKQRLHANPGKIFLAVNAQVFEENIAEGHAAHAPREV
jgi:hypothetical protein